MHQTPLDGSRHHFTICNTMFNPEYILQAVVPKPMYNAASSDSYIHRLIHR
jgi:hypothetical protein